MRQLGGAFGVAILVAVFSRTGSYASAQAFSNGFAPAIGACAALSLTGAIASLAAPSRRTATKIAAPCPLKPPSGLSRPQPHRPQDLGVEVAMALMSGARLGG